MKVTVSFTWIGGPNRAGGAQTAVSPIQSLTNELFSMLLQQATLWLIDSINAHWLIDSIHAHWLIDSINARMRKSKYQIEI